MSEATNAYEQACAHDRAAEEVAAIPHYEKALALGLPADERRGALVGLGSSLRNVGRCGDAVRVLRAAVSEYPNDAALAAFLALALYSEGHPREAVQTLLSIAIRNAPVGEYARALTAYRDALP